MKVTVEEALVVMMKDYEYLKDIDLPKYEWVRDSLTPAAKDYCDAMNRTYMSNEYTDEEKTIIVNIFCTNNFLSTLDRKIYAEMAVEHHRAKFRKKEEFVAQIDEVRPTRANNKERSEALKIGYWKIGKAGFKENHYSTLISRDSELKLSVGDTIDEKVLMAEAQKFLDSIQPKSIRSFFK